MRERATANSWKRRVLLGANRWVLAVALAGVVFASLLVVDVLHPVNATALLASISIIVFFDPTVPMFAAQTAGVSNAMVAIAAASTVAVFPFAILLSYVARIATVAKRTLSIGPFVLRETDRRADLDWGTAAVDDEDS
jgi:hypothetical protein